MSSMDEPGLSWQFSVLVYRSLVILGSLNSFRFLSTILSYYATKNLCFKCVLCFKVFLSTNTNSGIYSSKLLFQNEVYNVKSPLMICSLSPTLVRVFIWVAKRKIGILSLFYVGHRYAMLYFLFTNDRIWKLASYLWFP